MKKKRTKAQRRADAHAYRLQQARELIEGLVVYDGKRKRFPTYESDGAGGYRSSAAAKHIEAARSARRGGR